MIREEQNSVQQEIFATLLKTPHRAVDESLSIHKAQFDRDPEFYGHLAAWAIVGGNNSIRDLEEIFIAVLFASPYESHKEAAYFMMQSLPPYQVYRVCNYFTGWDEIVRHRSYDKKQLPENGKFGVTVERAKYGKSHPEAGKQIPDKKIALTPKLKKTLMAKGLVSKNDKEFFVKSYRISHQGLGKKILKGMIKKAVRSYLRFREREENRGMMEGALIRAKSQIHSLYYRSNTLPGGSEDSWINRYVFKGELDDNSGRLFALRQLAKSNDPIFQSKIIMDYKIPYPVAAGLISNMTPSVIVSLIDVMSPQELMSNLGSLQRRGVMDNEEIKAFIQLKLKGAKTARRVDAMKGGIAAKAVKALDEDVRKAVSDVTDSQLKKLAKISCKVALLIDKSGSMDKAVEFGKELASAIAQACENHDPFVYTFDSVPHLINWEKKDGDITKKSSWDKKLAMVKANGGTMPWTVIKSMEDNNILVDEIVVVTDEDENIGSSSLASSLRKYEKKMGIMPFVFIVRVAGNVRTMSNKLRDEGIEHESIDCTKIDQISMPNLIQRMARKSSLNLVQEIWEQSLPSRAEWDSVNKMTPQEIKKGLIQKKPQESSSVKKKTQSSLSIR